MNDVLIYGAEVPDLITVPNNFSKASSFPFIVPSSNIQVSSTSSTSLYVSWTSKWQSLWPRELRQIQIIYNSSENETAQNITVNPLKKSVELQDLSPFSEYCVRVLLVTHKGTGQRSTCVHGKTQQSGKYKVSSTGTLI